jgi:hypothetical protein
MLKLSSSLLLLLFFFFLLKLPCKKRLRKSLF